MSVCIVLLEELRHIANVMIAALPERTGARQVVDLLNDLAAVSRANHRAFVATYPGVETISRITAARLHGSSLCHSSSVTNSANVASRTTSMKARSSSWRSTWGAITSVIMQETNAESGPVLRIGTGAFRGETTTSVSMTGSECHTQRRVDLV